MSTAYTAWLPEVMPEVPGCPVPIITNEIKNAVEQFCEQSYCLRIEHDPLTGIEDLYEYDLEPPTDTVIVAITDANYNGSRIEPKTPKQLAELYADWRNEDGTPKYYTQATDRSKFRLVPYPSATVTDAIAMEIAYKPSASATTVDDVIYNDWHKPIAHGALAMLMNMRDKPWTSLNEADRYLASYNNAIQSAKKRAEMANLKTTTMTVTYGGIR